MTSPADEIATLEDRRWAAQIEADLAALDQMLAPEMSYTHSNGVVDSKVSYLAAIESAKFDYRSEERTDVAICVIDDTAMVTGRCAFNVVASGRDVNLDSRYSVVWVRRDGDWQFLCYQSTPLPS